jgi:hypothetical protein
MYPKLMYDTDHNGFFMFVELSSYRYAHFGPDEIVTFDIPTNWQPIVCSTN